MKAWDRYNRGELPRPPHAMSQLDLADAIRQAEADHPEFQQAAATLYQFLEAHWTKKRDARLITDNPRYEKAQATARTGSAVAYAAELQKAGYATDPEYARKLSGAIQSALRAQKAQA